MQFIKTFLASFTALIIFSIVAVIILFAVIGTMTAEEPVKVSENSILKLEFNKPITEQGVENPFEELGIGGNSGTIGLVELLRAIRSAAEDDNIKGIYIEPQLLIGGFSTIEEIRNALLEFKETGKFIVSYSDIYMEPSYYLATAADEIYMGPEGMLEFNGLSSSVVFLKGLFDKLDIETQIFRVGEYKSAVEPFMREDLSEENREQISELLYSLNGHMLQNISEARGIDYGILKIMSDSMAVRSEKDALESKLIDGIFYKDQIRDRIEELVEGEFNVIGLSKYIKTTNEYIKSKDKISVIVADGDIIGGKSKDNIAGERFANLVRESREDENVKAIVLRVNSPGGQMQASDQIWREIKLASESKPVIASFSNYAASGGYYIAMAADTIVAQPTTITGSIGIFGILFNFGGMLENKLGITVDDVGTGEYSTIYTVTRSLNEAERAIIQKQVERGYDTFVSKVAEGRGLSVEEVEAIASGRVWSGIQAKEIGLIDEYGGLHDAIDIAAETAGLKEYRLYVYPKKKDIFEELLEQNVSKEEELGLKYFGESYYILKNVREAAKYQGIQARLPFELKLN